MQSLHQEGTGLRLGQTVFSEKVIQYMSSRDLEAPISELTSAKPRVTVIIPCFNGRTYLSECLQSLTHADESVQEVIVVDDGSTEDFRDIVAAYAPLVRYVWQPHAGLAAARNTGIGMARGEYLRFLDCDDYFVSADGLAKQVAVLDHHPEVGLVYGQSLKVDGNRRQFGVRKPSFSRTSYVHSGEQELHRLLFYNHITVSSTLVRRTVIDRVGGFQPYPTAEDWDYWLRLAKLAWVAYVAEPIVAYRVHNSSMIATQRAEMRLQVHRDILDSLFRDPEFARQFGKSYERAHARLDLLPALIAYSAGNLRLTRQKAGVATLAALRSGHKDYATQAVGLWFKSLLPAWLFGHLRSIRREMRVGMTAWRNMFSGAN